VLEILAVARYRIAVASLAQYSHEWLTCLFRSVWATTLPIVNQNIDVPCRF